MQIRNGQREPGRLPSRSVRRMLRIYRRHPHVNSVVVTQPPNIMAFAVSGTGLKPHHPGKLPAAQGCAGIAVWQPFFKAAISDTLSTATPILLIENDSVLVTGKSVLEAFDRLEVAGQRALDYRRHQPRAALTPIGADDIEG
ncbi:MAG: class II aldolase/adducin family protein [Thiolinea sp.]